MEVGILLLTRRDFVIPNISNLPNTPKKLLAFINLFDRFESYSIKELHSLKKHQELGISKETFRKMVNHSAKVGILTNENSRYRLSDETINLIYNNFSDIHSYITTLIKDYDELKKAAEIILTLLKIFSPSLKTNTLYIIFSLIGKNRIDKSAQAAVGRNLRTIFSLLQMAEMIIKGNETLQITDNNWNEIVEKEVVSINHLYPLQVVNIKKIVQYLNHYFDTPLCEEILSCITTYEVENFIWTKSSLYKNQGEIKNLNGEFIMTVITKM